MMRAFLLLIGLLAGGVAVAQVYRWVDEDGVVHFSDRPHEGAEVIELPEAQTFSAPAISPRRSAPPETETEADEEAGYKSLRIIRPGQQEVLWNTGGLVDVEIDLEPQLYSGHSVALFLDGQQVGRLGTGQRNFQLSEVFRGTHAVRAEIQDADGNGLFESVAVTFTVQQTSLQNPNNPNVPPVPVPSLPRGPGG